MKWKKLAIVDEENLSGKTSLSYSGQRQDLPNHPWARGKENVAKC